MHSKKKALISMNSEEKAFLKRTWEWKKEYGGTITSQLRKDWFFM